MEEIERKLEAARGAGYQSILMTDEEIHGVY